MNILREIASRVLVDRATREFIRQQSGSRAGSRTDGSGGEVLVELYRSPMHQIVFGIFANILAERSNAAIRSFSMSHGDSLKYRVANRRALRVYRAFNSMGHVATGALNTAETARKAQLLSEALASLRTKEDLLSLVVAGVPIGCDVYEAYLAEYKEPTVTIGDPRVREILEICIHALLFWDRYLREHRVHSIIMSHGLYRYGVLVKLAQERGIPVYLPNALGITRITRELKPGTADYRKYPQLFRELPESQRREGLALAKKQLDRRFSAEVGVNMAYSTKSAFQRRADAPPAMRRSDRHKVLITTHCFFDNPHAYGGNPFPDFFEWLTFLGELSNQTDYDWYLKTHPDVIPENIPVIDGLLAKYPRITRLPPETSFHQLTEEGLKTVLTVYGSVGHELPLLGVQVVNAGYNPHIAYDFNFHAKGLEDYRRLILDLPNLRKTIDPNQIYEYYYTHYYASTAFDDFLFPSYSAMLGELGAQKLSTSAVYRYYLRKVGKDARQETLRKLEWFLESGQSIYQDQKFRGRAPVSGRDSAHARPSL